MSDLGTPIQISPEMLAAARELFAGRIADCAHCGGWSKPDPRRAPVRYESVLCLAEAHDVWRVCCFQCFASVSSTNTAAEAVERWNRRPDSGVQQLDRQLDMLPLVDLQKLALRSGIDLTPAHDQFARMVQVYVMSLNRRPLS